MKWLDSGWGIAAVFSVVILHEPIAMGALWALNLLAGVWHG